MERSLELVSEETAVAAGGANLTSPAMAAARRERLTLLTRDVILVLVVLMLLGLALRVRGLAEIGFAEDEINKLEAVRAYGRGDITPNAEHPMLMKTLIFISLTASQQWNARAGAAQHISEEAAVRFPNVLLGALTVFPLYLLAAAFFDKRTGLTAALLWSFGVNAITYNRIAKEDTLLIFFMLFAFYFYLRAKQTSGYEPGVKKKFYLASAVSFGLMLASKYFPHYFGLNMLYHHLVAQRERAPGEPRGRTPAIFYPVVFITFFLANPAVLLPQTWHYLAAYSSEGLLTHHGYLMGDTLYANQMSSTPFGTPFYFYLLFLAIKTPLPLLIALVAGLAACAFRRPKRPGEAFLLLMFVLWIVPYSIVGAKWLRYALSLMPLVYMLAAVGIMWLLRLLAPRRAGDGTRGGSFSPLQRVVRAFVLLFFIALPAWIAYAAGPHYATYTNALGAGRAGYFFPHDEFYDDGLREAIKYVADHAPRGASIVHETPGVARHYLQKFARLDLNSRVLSDPAFKFDETTGRPAYVILQRGRTYFENREKMGEARTRGRKVYEGFVGGLSAVEVYEVE